jgi:hypothetical protein
MEPGMNNFSIAIVFILFFVMMGLIIFYFQTQQSLKDLADRVGKLHESSAEGGIFNRLKDISDRVGKLQPQMVMRSPNVIRQERAAFQDRLVLLEVELTQNKRDSLTEEDRQQLESARDAIKRCNDELKQTGDWMGTPFDFEWTEMFNRMPILKSLYWASVEGLAAVDNQGLSGDPRGTVARQK